MIHWTRGSEAFDGGVRWAKNIPLSYRGYHVKFSNSISYSEGASRGTPPKNGASRARLLDRIACQTLETCPSLVVLLCLIWSLCFKRYGRIGSEKMWLPGLFWADAQSTIFVLGRRSENREIWRKSDHNFPELSCADYMCR